MVLARARTINGVGTWIYDASLAETGAVLTTKAPVKDI
jgi:hypothetical protein